MTIKSKGGESSSAPSKQDLGSSVMLILGLAILVFGNSPAAAGGAFVGAGLCVIAEAIASHRR